MNLNMHYQICDDWGWFIDIESDNYCKNVLLQPCRSPIKKFNSHLNKLPTIEEDEYEYYQKNYKDPEEKIYKEEITEEKQDINLQHSNKNRENSIFNIGSTTFVTAVLTYFIFIVL
jgi:hypothetical protein